MSSELIYEAIMAAPLDEPISEATARRIAYEVTEAVGTSQSDMELLRRQWAESSADARKYELVLSAIFGASPDWLVVTETAWWNTESKHFGMMREIGVEVVPPTHDGLLAGAPDGFQLLAGPEQERPDLGRHDAAGDTEFHRVDDAGMVWERVLCFWPDWTPLTALPSWLQPVTNPRVLDSKTPTG